MILAMLGYVTQEAKALALQKEHKRDKDKGILMTHITAQNIQSHNIAYQAFEDSCLDQGSTRLVGTLSTAIATFHKIHWFGILSDAERALKQGIMKTPGSSGLNILSLEV
jgi:hypothetical protein